MHFDPVCLVIFVNFVWWLLIYLVLMSTYTVQRSAWSISGGIVWALFTRVGLLVKTRSRMLSPHVGPSTTWVRPLSLAMLMSRSHIAGVTALGLVVFALQSTPDMLKSPPKMSVPLVVHATLLTMSVKPSSVLILSLVVCNRH